MARDRITAILQSTRLNGIDFIAIANQAQTELQVHFLNAVPIEDRLTARPTITGGETIPSVAVLPIAGTDWGWDDGHVVLTLRVAAPGDFSLYTLTLASPVLDPFFATRLFSFKAGCPSDLDCAPVAPLCPPAAADLPTIDYLAKDFLSFRQALMDFSTLRYPAWQERAEADFGVMMLEALSALADDLSYQQDRVAQEAALSTATERRSVLRHARLLDYEPRPALSATTVLQFDVAADTSAIAHGIAVVAPSPDGTPVTFETGFGLRDSSIPPPASALWNRSPGIDPYWFDDSVRCLPTGATRMDVFGHGYAFQPGQRLLIETAAATSADPPLRQIVQLLPFDDPGGPYAEEIADPLFPLPVAPGGPPYFTAPSSPPDATAPAAVTRLRWRTADALTDARDLTRTCVMGNIADATQGRTVRIGRATDGRTISEQWVVGDAPPGFGAPPAAIERTGPLAAIEPGRCGTAPAIRLHTLAQSPLTWFAQADVDPSGLPVAEIRLFETPPEGDAIEWRWARRLLVTDAFDDAFTIDPGAYRVIARNSDGALQSDYDGDEGDTVRFGDGVFGRNPETGMACDATYRFGAGASGNVAAGAVSTLDPATIATGAFVAVMNPFAAGGGADAQTLDSVRRLAPQAFRATQYRAVIGQDYVDAAETLPWVERAGSAFRWTGSWLTTFTTPEPRASEQIAIDDRIGLIRLLDRYRMAGTESYVPDPIYVSLDLEIELCAAPGAFAANVKAGVLAALSPTGPGAAKAFFAPGAFVFGQPLDKSRLEARIQAAPGVSGVTCIHYRLRDRTGGFQELGDTLAVGASQIIRCDNDPSRPNNGSIALTVRGGQ